MTDDAFHLTALDARRYDFGNALRGYDRARVDAFRDQVAEELERLSRANQELEVKARNFHEQLRAFRERDKALNDALISAQQLRGEIREQAQREAQLIIREAQGDAERSLEVLRGEIRRAEDDLQQLWRNRRSYVQQLRQLMERQVHDLDSAEMVPPPVGLTNSEAGREPMRDMARAATPEFQASRDEPRLAHARDTAIRDTGTRDTATRDTTTRDTATRDTATRDTATPVHRMAQPESGLPRAPRPESVSQRVLQPEPVAQRAPQPQPQPEPAPQRAPQAEPVQRAPQQPWARPAAVEPEPVMSPNTVPPLMQPVPHPLPPMSTQPAPVQPTSNSGMPPVAPSPQAVPPVQPRSSLPTPSWLDVVEGE